MISSQLTESLKSMEFGDETITSAWNAAIDLSAAGHGDSGEIFQAILSRCGRHTLSGFVTRFLRKK